MKTLILLLLCGVASAADLRPYSLSPAAGDTRYVNITGDTMSGPLTVTSMTVTYGESVSSVTLPHNGKLQWGATGSESDFNGRTWNYNLDSSDINILHNNGGRIYMATGISPALTINASGSSTFYSSVTVTGNAFSVGGSTFVVSGGHIGITNTIGDLNSQLSVIGVAGLPNNAKSPTAIFGSNSYTGVGVGSINASPYGTYLQGMDIRQANYTQYPLLLNPDGGNVGIGTTAPAYKLVIQSTTAAITGGDFNVDTTDGASQIIMGRLGDSAGGNTTVIMRDRTGSPAFTFNNGDSILTASNKITVATSLIIGTALNSTTSYLQIDTLAADTAGPPAAGDCDAATEVGRMVLSSRYTATADNMIWVCLQTAASTYAWWKTALTAP